MVLRKPRDKGLPGSGARMGHATNGGAHSGGRAAGLPRAPAPGERVGGRPALRRGVHPGVWRAGASGPDGAARRGRLAEPTHTGHGRDTADASGPGGFGGGRGARDHLPGAVVPADGSRHDKSVEAGRDDRHRQRTDGCRGRRFGRHDRPYRPSERRWDRGWGRGPPQGPNNRGRP